jgi:hypothetical protein
MQALIRKESVARKRHDRPNGAPRGEGIPVRIAPDIVGKAKVVVARKNRGLGPYFSELLRAQVDRDYQEVLRELKDESVK